MSAPDFATLSELLTLPVELHVFHHADRCLAFDVRNFAIVSLDAAGAFVLSQAADLPLDSIIAALNPDDSILQARYYYLRLLDLIQEGVLSSQPVPRPARPPFHRLVLMLSGGCNLACSYCFEREVPIYQAPNLLSRDKADAILDWYFGHLEGSQAYIQLYGGEPLLNWPMLQYVVERSESICRARDLELTLYLITNGTLLNEQRIAYLSLHNVIVQVSVDGDAETHDRFRRYKNGRPTLAAIRSPVKQLGQAQVRHNLRAVLTRQNMDVAAVMASLRELGAEEVSFEIVAADLAEAQFTGEDWPAFFGRYADYLSSPFVTWVELPAEMQTVITRICEGRRVVYGCGAGISEVTVDPSGAIYECERMYRPAIGQVSDDRSPAELDGHFLITVDDHAVCRTCWARYLCGGSCRHEAHLAGADDGILPQRCAMKRMLAEAAIARIYEISHPGAAGSAAPLQTSTPCITDL